MSADDEIRVDPMPEYASGTLDFGKVGHLVGNAVAAVDDEIHSEILEAIVAGACTLTIAGPDDHGYFDARTIYSAGGDLLGTVRIHWSQLLP